MQADVLQLVRDLPPEQPVAGPEGRGRSIHGILEHVAESHGVYLRYHLGKVDGLPQAVRAVRQGAEGLPAALTHLRQIADARWRP